MSTYFEQEVPQAHTENSNQCNNIAMWNDDSCVSQNDSYYSLSPSIIQYPNSQGRFDTQLDYQEVIDRRIVPPNYNIKRSNYPGSSVITPNHKRLMLNHYLYNETENQFQNLKLRSQQCSDTADRTTDSDFSRSNSHYHSPDSNLGYDNSNQQFPLFGKPCPTCKCRCRSWPLNAGNQEQDDANLENENGIPEGDNGRYSIFRSNCKSDIFEDSEDGTRLKQVELKFTSDISFKTINQIPWTAKEENEGRRIIRVTRVQRRNILSLELLIIAQLSQHLNQTSGSNYVEVSCIKYIHSNRGRVNYLITSVEVIKIIELLTGSAWRDPLLRRIERGRLRSNLATLWLKEFLAIKSNHTNKACLKLLEQLSNYKIRKPYNVWKDLRLMHWDNLIVALSKVLGFYRVRTSSNSPSV